eukprot:3231655-Prymnesium_polylepis.1
MREGAIRPSVAFAELRQLTFAAAFATSSDGRWVVLRKLTTCRRRTNAMSCMPKLRGGAAIRRC